MSGRRMVSALVAVVVLSTPGVEAQDRAALVDQARAELPGSSVALDLLMEASNPETASVDSMWAVAGYDMAEDLINIGETDLAAVWLRWVVRHGEEWSIDRVWYSQAVESAYDVAVEAVDSDGALGDPSTSTDWRWPGSFDEGEPGTLEAVSADPSVDLDVTVEGAGAVGADGTMELPPRTYRITASAPGYDEIEVSREILPGVTTVLSFDLPPDLTSSGRTMAMAALARVSFTQNGQLVCTNGVVTGRGLVLTTTGSGIQQATGIQVVTPRGTFDNLVPGPTDPGRGLIVLRPDEGVAAPDLGPATSRAEAEPSGGYAWSVFQPGCADPTVARTRFATWPDGTQTPVNLSAPLQAAAAGSPLVDDTGAWLGIVTGSTTVLPAPATDDLLEAGLRVVAPPDEGGGVPGWVWIGGGAAAAGVAALLLLGGEDTPTERPPTTGGLSITFPPIG